MVTGTEQALQSWASMATDEQLATGPTLDDLRGVDAVLADAHVVCRGPQLPYLMQAAASGLANLDTAHHDALLAALRGGIREPDSGWVLNDAIDVLCEHPALLDRLAATTARTLYDHADAALRAEGTATLAHPALLGLLRLAVAERTTQHRLLTLLTEITGDEPADALDRLPLLIGLAHDHFGGNDLPEVLVRLADNPRLSTPTRADATFELALADLHLALAEHDPSITEDHLRRALLRLHTTDQGQENRHDARLYTAAIDAVLVFSEFHKGNEPETARGRLSALTDRLETDLTALYAWNSGHHDLPWLAARGQTLGAWARLVTTLRTAATRLTEPSWYDAASALNQLLDVYLADRAIRSHPTHDDGLGTLIFPAIESAFLRHSGLLHHLDQALVHDPQFIDHPDAIALRDAIRARQATVAQEGEVMPGKALEYRPALAGLLADGKHLLHDDLDPDLLDSIETLLQHRQHGFAATGNVRFDDLLAGLLARLAQSPQWRPPFSTEFTTLLEQVLRFLHSRFDAQADLYGARTAYLGPRPPDDDGKPQTWPEKAIQDDLHDHLAGQLTPDTVQREIIDVAGGRTDITYTPRPGNRFVIETKRREPKATKEAIERSYLAQATNYTATGPPFGILIVADHGPHTAGYASLDDSVWITSVARSATETPRLIVIGVLPIGRPTPSDLRMPR
ncbi:hypothetical protein Q5530_06155 [Saccharothrix sp. BKS2]|uniref:hypothetical protein n=1 Tax=Saccharothrix sp. BKS2 TaxID=3064400 RepID=UPI0039E989BF